jgi:hypothetical protein
MHPTVVDARLCLQLYLARGFAGHTGTAWCSPGGVPAYFISFHINGHYVGSLYACSACQSIPFAAVRRIDMLRGFIDRYKGE